MLAKTFILIFIINLPSRSFGFQLFREEVIVNSSELMVFTLTPGIFNWDSIPEMRKQVEYSARISQAPDLPSWLFYTYNGSSSTGYLYGVPPEDLKPIDIDVIARNRNESYEIRQLVLSLIIESQPRLPFSVELKVDSMDIRDLCDLKGRDLLTSTFAQYLDWMKIDGSPVTLTYLAPATSLETDRSIPWEPFEAEGVIVHLASNRNFSSELMKLQKEVRSLWKLRPCPRNLKRTSMEKYFRTQGIVVDWCSFQLVIYSTTTDSGSTKPREDSTPITESKGLDTFRFRSDIPEKNYGPGFLLATLVPGAIGTVIAILIFGVFCTDEDETSPVFKDENKDSDALLENTSLPAGSYHPYNAPGSDDDYFLLTGDGRGDSEMEFRHNRAMTPLPPQYIAPSRRSPTPALQYAV